LVCASATIVRSSTLVLVITMNNQQEQRARKILKRLADAVESIDEFNIGENLLCVRISDYGYTEAMIFDFKSGVVACADNEFEKLTTISIEEWFKSQSF